MNWNSKAIGKETQLFFFSSNAHLGLRVLYLFVTHLKNFLFSLRYGTYENVRNYKKKLTLGN